MSFKGISSLGVGVPPPPRARPPPPPAHSTVSSPDPGDDTGGDEDSKTIPAFLLKTFNMVSDPNTNHIVCWNDKGDGFIVKNEHEFALAVLPVYFRHKNFSSFVRQLNFYGFRKRSNKSSYSQFSHPLFVRGQVEKLRHIKRKTADANVCTSSSTMKDSLANLQTQVSELKDQYDHIWKIQHQILYILSQFVRGSPEASAILNNVANPLKRARIGDRTDNGRGAPRRRPLLDGSNPAVPAIDSVPDHNSDDDAGSAADEWNSLAQIKEIVDSLPKGANVLQGGAAFPLPARSTSSTPAVSAAAAASSSSSSPSPSTTAVAPRRVGPPGPAGFDVTSKVQRFSVPQLQDLNDGSKLSPFTSSNGHFSLSLNSPPFSTFVEDQELARFGSTSGAGPSGVSITEVPMDSDALSTRSGPTPDPWFENAHAAATAAESILASAGHDLPAWNSSSGPTLTPAQAQSLTAALVQAHAVHAARSRKNSGPLPDTALTMRSPSRPNIPSPGGLSVGSNRWDAPGPDLPMPSLGRGSSTTSSLGPIPNIELLDRHDELGHSLNGPLIGPDHFPPPAHDDLDPLVPPPPSFLPPSPLSPALSFGLPSTVPQLDPSTAAAALLARANSLRRR